VPRPARAAEAAGTGRLPLEVADIFRAHGEAYRQGHALSAEQRKAMRDIEACRTEALGGHLDVYDVCDQCGYTEPSYNSCRNRHCPKCQSVAQHKWIEGRKARILPTHYFHVVFTIPAKLRAIAFWNAELVYALLFRTASETLLELSRDPHRLGAQPGITAVLHTWTRTLLLHPHLHCIVTGGGLTADGSRWIHAKRKYLFPVKVLSKLFRGKFLDGLVRAQRKGELRLVGRLSAGTFERLIDALYEQDWVVYAKRAFLGPEHVFEYLGRYTHRVGISNQRLLAMDDRGITFVTRDNQTVTLPPEKFIQRFLLHVLPKGFVKIRHYGLLSSSYAKTRLETARALLPPAPPAKSASEAVGDDTGALTEPDREQARHCPVCKVGRMIRMVGPFPMLPASASVVISLGSGP